MAGFRYFLKERLLHWLPRNTERHIAGNVAFRSDSRADSRLCHVLSRARCVFRDINVSEERKSIENICFEISRHRARGFRNCFFHENPGRLARIARTLRNFANLVTSASLTGRLRSSIATNSKALADVTEAACFALFAAESVDLNELRSSRRETKIGHCPAKSHHFREKLISSPGGSSGDNLS